MLTRSFDILCWEDVLSPWTWWTLLIKYGRSETLPVWMSRHFQFGNFDSLSLRTLIPEAQRHYIKAWRPWACHIRRKTNAAKQRGHMQKHWCSEGISCDSYLSCRGAEQQLSHISNTLWMIPLPSLASLSRLSCHLPWCALAYLLSPPPSHWVRLYTEVCLSWLQLHK